MWLAKIFSVDFLLVLGLSLACFIQTYKPGNEKGNLKRFVCHSEAAVKQNLFYSKYLARILKIPDIITQWHARAALDSTDILLSSLLKAGFIKLVSNSISTFSLQGGSLGNLVAVLLSFLSITSYVLSNRMQVFRFSASEQPNVSQIIYTFRLLMCDGSMFPLEMELNLFFQWTAY